MANKYETANQGISNLQGNIDSGFVVTPPDTSGSGDTKDKSKKWLALQALGATLEDIGSNLRGERATALPAFQENQTKLSKEQLSDAKEAEKIAKARFESKKQLDSLMGTFGDDIDPSKKEKYQALYKASADMDDPMASFKESVSVFNNLNKKQQDEILYPSLSAASEDIRGSGLEVSSAKKKGGGYDVGFARPKVDYGDRRVVERRKALGDLRRWKRNGAPVVELEESALIAGFEPEEFPEIFGEEKKKSLWERLKWRKPSLGNTLGDSTGAIGMGLKALLNRR